MDPLKDEHAAPAGDRTLSSSPALLPPSPGAHRKSPLRERIEAELSSLTAGLEAERAENARLRDLLAVWRAKASTAEAEAAEARAELSRVMASASRGGGSGVVDGNRASENDEVERLRKELDALRRRNDALARELQLVRTTSSASPAMSGDRTSLLSPSSSSQGRTQPEGGRVNATLPSASSPAAAMTGTGTGKEKAVSVLLYQHPPGFRQPSRDPDCLTAHALLRLAGVSYGVRNCVDGSVSPTGELPLLRRLPGVTDAVVVGCREIQRYATGQATGAAAAVLAGNSRARGTMDAFVELVMARCRPAALYELWCEPLSFAVAEQMYGRETYPWPLSVVLSQQRQWEVRASVLGCGRVASREELFDNATAAYAALALLLGDQNYFFGNSATVLDAFVYGHVAHVLSADLPSQILRSRILAHPNLVEFCSRFQEAYFPRE